MLQKKIDRDIGEEGEVELVANRSGLFNPLTHESVP